MSFQTLDVNETIVDMTLYQDTVLVATNKRVFRLLEDGTFHELRFKAISNE